MNKRTFCAFAATVFLIVALAHLLRIILGWDVTVGGSVIPLWISWVAVIAAGTLSYFGFKNGRS